MLIKPSKTSIKSLLEGIRETVKGNATCKTEHLIYLLNPKIRGWANYYRHVVSKDIFSYIDHKIFLITWSWAKRRHVNRGERWVWRKYFPDSTQYGLLLSRYTEGGIQKRASLVKASSTLIRRHVKIKADANPYDPNYFAYFVSRSKGKTRKQKG